MFLVIYISIRTKAINVQKEAPKYISAISKSLTTATKGYFIQVGSFFKKISPAYVAKINNNGYPYVIQKVVATENTTIRRVLIGPFDSPKLAMDSLSMVREKISKNAYLKTLP